MQLDPQTRQKMSIYLNDRASQQDKLFMVLFYLLLLLIPALAEDENCPGWCGNPVEEIKLWTDNPHVWRCELPSVVVLPCADEAYISCRRLDDLGGDLYLMLFADSPDDIGIDPDFLAKGRVDTLRTVIECKDGKWTPPNSTIQMTHILCDQYIINKTKAEESPFKPLPWKPEVVTSTIGTTNESSEEESTKITSTSASTETTTEDLEDLETIAHNATSTITVDSVEPEKTAATNPTAIEMTTDSTDLMKTTRMSSSTSLTSLADTSPKVPQATTTIFFDSTTTLQSEKKKSISFTGITLKHITHAMATIPMPLFTTVSTKPLFLPTSTAPTISQATKEVTVAKNELSPKNVTIVITTPELAEQSTTIVKNTTSTDSPNSTPSGKAPVPKFAQKPTGSPITSTFPLTTVGSASTTKLTTMPKTMVTNKMKTTMGQQHVESIKSVTLEKITGSSTKSPNSAQFSEMTTPSSTYALNSTTPILANNSKISVSTTITIVTSNISQVLSVQVTKPATESTSMNTTTKRSTSIPSTAEFESAIVLLPPRTIELLPTSQQISRHTTSAADIILLQPDPYEGVIEPVVILEEKLAIPSRMSRSGGTKEKKLRFRKKIVPPAAKVSRKIQEQKAARRRTILAIPQRRQNRIKKKETKSRTRQHVERKIS